MTAPQSPRRAFTLIELMISIALGAAIVVTASAGLRMAAQSFTAAQRLARSNEMLEIGVTAALDEVDYWTEYDDPQGGASRQRLRDSEVPSVVSATGHPLRFGLPFSPFDAAAAAASASGGVGGFAPVWAAGSQQGYGYGWQDDERLWAVSADNELTWWTGNVAETQEGDVRFGHYSIFGVSRLPSEDPVTIDGGTWGGVGGWQPRNGGGRYGTIPFGPEPPPPTQNGGLAPGTAVAASYRHGTAAGQGTAGWLYNQIHGLSNALGWYGMMDYLPANTIDCYATQYHLVPGNGGAWLNVPADSTDAAGRPIFMEQTFAAQVGFGYGNRPYYNLQAFSPNWCPHSMDFLTSYTAFALLPVNHNQQELRGQTLDTDALVFYHRSYGRMNSDDMPLGSWGTNNSSSYVEPQFTIGQAAVNPSQMITGQSSFTAFADRSTSDHDLMPTRPQVWPDVAVSVGRYLRLCRYSTQATVDFTDPLTGERVGLAFTAMGTTLRGARRQRLLDGNTR